MLNESRLEGLTIDQSYEVFLFEYKRVCNDDYIPLKNLINNKRPAWIDSDTMAAIKAKRKLWHANQRTNWKSTSLVKQYKVARNRSAKKVNQSVKEYELKFANDKKNPKRLFWLYIFEW